MKKIVGVIIGLVIIGLVFVVGLCFGISKIVQNRNQFQKQEKINQVDESQSEEKDNIKNESAEGAQENVPESDVAEEEQETETVYEIGESATLKDWEISVTDMQIVESIAADYGTFSPNESGNKYAQVFVTATNNGKQAERFLPTVGIGDDVNAKIIFGDGYEFSATNLLGYNNDIHDSTINPLSSQTGEIAFEIPPIVADSTDELFIEFSSGTDVVKIKIR